MEVQKMKHVCKFCKKSFPCGRSLGGHIRSHLPKPGYELRENPKKTWRVTTNDHQQDVVIDSTTVSSSSTETENPKTSKMNPNQGKRSNFGRNNNSHSSVSEVVEAEHHQQQEEEVVVAMCLIMLSKDEGSWGKISSSFTTLTESSENNLLHQGKKNKSKRRRREKKQGNVSVSVAGNGKKFESTTCGYLQKGLKLKGIEVSANGFCSNDSKIKSFESKRKREKVVESKKSDFTAVTDDHDAVKCGKVESSASGYGKNGGKINEFEVLGNGFVSNDQNNQTPESKRKFIGQCSGFRNVKKWSKLEEFEVSQNGFSSYDQKNNYNNNNNNNGHSEMDSEFCKTRSKFECTTCNKVFHSYQALGGHRASHKKLMGGGKCSSPMTLPKLEAEIDTDDVDHQSTEEVQQQSKLQSQQKQEMGSSNMVIGSSSSSKKAVQKHECPICYRVFSSGQALGGHKRSHLIIASSPNAEINDRNSEVKMIDKAQNRGIVERLSSSEARDMLDLNFPPAQDETNTTTTTNSSSNSLVGFMKPYWCVESSHKHEQLLGLISN